MPKKTATVRGGAQRNKPRVSKSFEVVRQGVTEQEQESEAKSGLESTVVNRSTSTVSEAQRESAKSIVNAAPKGSAAARLATRRQAAQKEQQRVANSLVTAEHFTYVRKDLIFIAILATIMFSAIIILHFIPGIGS